MGGDNRESIAQSIARIVKHRKSEIDEGNIIIATVKEVYSDILELDTFGTMDVILQPSEIEIPEIQLNAHVNNDGTTGISGKYTFPKVGSDIILIMDYRNGHEFYYPLFFSHVDKTFEQFDVEKTSKIVEVTTNDINDPYNTEETGKYSEETQTFEGFDKKVENDDGDIFVKKQNSSLDRTQISDGSNTTNIESTSSSHNIESNEVLINTNTAISEDTAVLYSHLSSCVDAIVVYIDAVNAAIGTIPLTPAVTQPLKQNINTPKSAMEASNIKLK